MRYFYTDPLEAAYMAKHYGMKFNAHMGDKRQYWCEDIDELSKILGYHDGDDKIVARSDKWYLSADSLHLLEPQVGDLIRDYIDLGEVLRISNESPDDDIRNLRAEYFEGRDIIIQRNGKAFFWPQVEE